MKSRSGLIAFSLYVLPILLMILTVTLDSIISASGVNKYEFLLLCIFCGIFSASVLYIGDKLNQIIVLLKGNKSEKQA